MTGPDGMHAVALVVHASNTTDLDESETWADRHRSPGPSSVRRSTVLNAGFHGTLIPPPPEIASKGNTMIEMNDPDELTSEIGHPDPIEVLDRARWRRPRTQWDPWAMYLAGHQKRKNQ